MRNVSIPSDQNPFSENPYAAPQSTDPTVVNIDGSPEAIRKAYIAHEASIKSVGCLYFFGGIILVILAITVLGQALFLRRESSGLDANRGPVEDVMLYIFSFFYFAIGIGQMAAAIGMRALKPWARWAGVGISGLGLLGFPCGTIISGYILYLLLSKKGEFIFSEPYKHVIAQTPDVKYRTSKAAWVVLILLILVIVLIFVIGLSAK